MAPQGFSTEEIDKLKELRTQAGGSNEALKAKIQEWWLGKQFLSKARATKVPTSTSTNQNTGLTTWDDIKKTVSGGLKKKDTAGTNVWTTGATTKITTPSTKWITKKTTPTDTTTTSDKTEVDVSGLGQGYQAIYNTLDPIAKKQFDLIADTYEADQTKLAEEQIKLLSDYKLAQERAEEDQWRRERLNEISGEKATIQEEQTLRKYKQDVQNLKQNVGYLGTQGQPGVSSVKLDAVERQIDEAETVYSELKNLVRLQREARQIGEDDLAVKYERQMADLGKSLNDNVNQALQDALNNFNSQETLDKLETVEDVEQLRQTLLGDLDETIAWITDQNLAERQFLLDEYKDIATSIKEAEEAKLEVNKDLSTVKGFYVDGTGAPILDVSGNRINIPAEAPIDPIFKDGKLVQFKTGANGQIEANVTEVLDEATASDKTAANYAQLVLDEKIKPSDVPSEFKNNETYVNALATGTPSTWEDFIKTWSGNITQDYGATSPLKVDNVKLANGKVWTPWVDIDGNIGDKVDAFAGGTVVSAKQVPGYGNQVIVEDAQGNMHLYNHLEGFNVTEGDTIDRGQQIATMGNTGSVVPGAGWDGSHLDYRVSDNGNTTLKGGNWIDPNEFIWIPDVDSVAIQTFNNSTFKPQKDLKTEAEKAQYKSFVEKKNAVMSDKNADIQDVLAYSAGGKDLTDTSIKSLTKFDQALNQLSSIQQQISDAWDTTWPILGRLRNLNPYDTDAQVLKRSLTSLIPNLARGVYGEVWVLTDNDIRLYADTIPNLQQTWDVNKAVLAMTLQTLAEGYKKQLQINAAAGKDVSGFSWVYDSLSWQVDALRAEIGIPPLGEEVNSSQAIVYTDPDGTEYNNDALIEEMDRQITEWDVTPEEVQAWLQARNITLK